MDLGSIPREALAVIAAFAVGVALLQAFAAWSRGRVRRRKLSIRMDRAVRGEERARAWLEELGYEVLGAQVVAQHSVEVDGLAVIVPLRADYLAARRGLRYVVEVKTGSFAPRIETSATRRQMLEYRIAFDVDGVLLVDGETGKVHAITFPALDRLAPSRSGSSWRVFAFVVAATAAAVVAFVRFA